MKRLMMGNTIELLGQANRTARVLHDADRSVSVLVLSEPSAVKGTDTLARDLFARELVEANNDHCELLALVREAYAYVETSDGEPGDLTDRFTQLLRRYA